MQYIIRDVTDNRPRKDKTQQLSNPGARSPVRSLRISDELFQALRKRATDDGVTTSEVVRKALVEYLDVHDIRGVAGRRDREPNTNN